MMDQFVLDLTQLWKEVGLELKPRIPASMDSIASSNKKLGTSAKLGFCPQGGEKCEYCQKPLLFENLEARVHANNDDTDGNNSDVMMLASGCQKPNCPQLVSTAA